MKEPGGERCKGREKRRNLVDAMEVTHLTGTATRPACNYSSPCLVSPREHMPITPSGIFTLLICQPRNYFFRSTLKA